VEGSLVGSNLRALLYADDMALVAATADDLQELIDKIVEHAKLNQYQLSFKRSKHMVLGDSTKLLVDGKATKIMRPSCDISDKPMAMKQTDRCTYLGLEFHEMLGAHKRISHLFKHKRTNLNKVFVGNDKNTKKFERSLHCLNRATSGRGRGRQVGCLGNTSRSLGKEQESLL